MATHSSVLAWRIPGTALTKKRVKPDMFALSTLMFVVILVLLVLMNIAQTKADKKGEKKYE